jgi:predicted TIM-barrel fold metal-dependent hydrolase
MYPKDVPTTGGRVPASYDELKEDVLDASDAERLVLNCLTMWEAHHNPYFQAALAAALNDWLAAEFLDRDERLRASLVVPWSDPEAAAAEIDRCGDDRRFVQVLLPVRAIAPWGQKAHHRLFAAAAERGLAVALHAWGISGHAPTPAGLTRTYSEDYLSNGMIVQEHVAALVASGLFGRHPELRVVLVECGFTWLPSFLWRMDKHWKSLGPEIPWVTEKPSETVKRQMRATTAPAQLGAATPEQVRELVDMIGADWLLYASDHPHDHGPSGERLLAAVDDPAREAILAGNAAALYSL